MRQAAARGPHGQTRCYGLRVVAPKGKNCYKIHTEAKFFSDVMIEDVNFDMEFPPIMHHIRGLHMGFIFDDPMEYGSSMQIGSPDAYSHFVTIRGVEVRLTPLCLNKLLGTAELPPAILIGINISPTYQDIRHTLCGVNSTVKWTRHGHRGYHQAYPYAHLNREARVLLKIIMNCSVTGLYYIDVTWDRVGLVYAPMRGIDINVGAALKSVMRKEKVHRGR